MLKTKPKVKVGDRAFGKPSTKTKKATTATVDFDEDTEVMDTEVAVDDQDFEDASNDDDGEAIEVTPKGKSPAPLFQVVSGVADMSPWFKLLFYGEHKAGKTIIGASAADVPELGDVIYLDVDRSMKSIIPSGAVQNYGSLSTIDIRDYSTFVGVYKFLVAHCEARQANDVARLERMAQKHGFDPNKRFRTVIIDTINNVERMNHEHVYGTKDVAFTREVDSGDWGKVNKHSTIMTDLLRKFRDLNMNVIMLCHAKYAKNKAKVSNWEPDLQGALAGFVQRNIDMVCFMTQGLPVTLRREDDFSDDDDDGLEDLPNRGKAKAAPAKAKAPTRKGNVVRTIYVQPIGPFSASSRLTEPSLLKYENATMVEIYNSIKKELREANKNAA